MDITINDLNKTIYFILCLITLNGFRLADLHVIMPRMNFNGNLTRI